jgi:hypothetical protein
MRHDFEDGKYTVISNNGVLSALRYGDAWRKDDLIGDNLVLAMLTEVDELKRKNAELQAAIKEKSTGTTLTIEAF